MHNSVITIVLNEITHTTRDVLGQVRYSASKIYTAQLFFEIFVADFGL